MPWNFDTKRFDPPMLFAEILLLPKKTDQVFHVEDFVFYKSNQLKLSLSRPERMFKDTAGIYSEILSDGWSSPFDQIYTWSQFSDIIEVLTFCGHPIAAGLITEARQIYYQGRTDLDSIEARIEAGVDGGHLTPEEESRFYDIGEAFEKQAESAYYPDLMKWVVAHQDEFTEFREA